MPRVPLAGLMACAILAAPPARGDDPPRDRDVIARAGAGVIRLQQALPRIVARETMVQHAQASRSADGVPVSDRRLVSELGWATLGHAPDLLAIRDVVEVDGAPVTTERQRLQRLLESGSATLAEAERLLNEGARYNLTPGSRNFNLPTVVLFFLHPDTSGRFSWSRQSPRTSHPWRFTFKERDRPTIIRDGSGRPIFSRGSVDIDAGTGAVERTEVHLRFGRVEYSLTTTFATVAALGLMLPARMDEEYDTPTGTVTGTATYDDYRQFETGGRLIP
jgi:hypothetical protein